MQSVSGMVTQLLVLAMPTGQMYARCMQHDSCDAGPGVAPKFKSNLA